MSSNTTTKTTKSTKSNKAAKSADKLNTIVETDNTDNTEQTTTTTETMHDFSSRFDKDHVFASNVLEAIEHLANSKVVSGFDLEKAWALFDTMSVKERHELNLVKAKKAKKSTAVTADNFVPEGTKKPRGVRDLFRSQFRLEQAKQKKQYTDAEFREAWDNITEKELQALTAQRDEMFKKYEEERKAQLKDKIALGEVDEKSPKSPPNAFFIFKDKVTTNPSNFLTKSEAAKFSEMKSKDQAKFLGEKYKLMKDNNDKLYQDLQSESDAMMPKHNFEKYEWKLRCSRRKLARAERLDEDVEKWKTTVLTLENEPPEGYEPTSASTSVDDGEAKPKVEVEVKVKEKGHKKGKKAKTSSK